MALTDIVTIAGEDLTTADMFARDCAFPIMRIEKVIGQDDVLAQMPVGIGEWAAGTLVPIQLSQAIDIDTSVIVDDCDTAVVTSTLTEGSLTAPDQAKIKVRSNRLQIDELVPAFCRMRNILPRGSHLLNPDGSINTGSPYALDFARFAYSTVARALGAIISERILRGDASDEFGIDGFYTQLDDGWAINAASVPAELNQAVAINWQTFTGSGAAASPDDLTVAGLTFSLWGDTVNIPEDLNLATLFDDYLIPAVEKNWSSGDGGVDVWELHVPIGAARCIVRSAACMQPCNPDGVLIDADLRTRYARLANSQIIELYPSGRRIVVLESRHVAANTMYFGPRSIGGSPTYGVVFRDIDAMFNEIGWIGDTYAQRGAMPADNEPLLIDTAPELNLPFESRVIHADAIKESIDCVSFAIMAIVGVLVTERHLWTKITNVTCATWVEEIASGVTIDGVAIEH